ncbi:MAG: hypothetical protein AVDCRST_MAG87-2616 [uncultured Thermomicrobiales bacterium]|uniref:DnaJ homologue subfamily C member 28 conserved domain-containing protein n=1 Tax=uncultured Thermomicrobiales bacterium TaxID=1645740 RepID=A0A6J4VBV2_9BACT|nr:MAG: hypothetical protein AVDCRST_MAG87-2616 [uncultured Thermomicrobiales bacterium]
MSPVRHEDDFRSREIESWDSWVEEAIEEARQRGEFDDLPGQGKPLKIETNAYAPELNLALSALKSAGYAPTWMELDRQITTGRAELDAFLERSASYLCSLRESLMTHDGRGPRPAPKEPDERTLVGRLRAFWRSLVNLLDFASDLADEPLRQAPEPTLADLPVIRSRMRAQYLEQAAALDKLVMEFHGALPRALWHLERTRLGPEAAVRRFDARMDRAWHGPDECLETT